FSIYKAPPQFRRRQMILPESKKRGRPPVPVSAPPPSGPRLLTYPELRARKGIPFSRSELRRRELKGTFPRHITLGEGFEPLDRVDRERGRRLHRCPDGGATRVRRSRAARRASRPMRNAMADKEEFQADNEENKKKPKEADILIGLAQSAELFHSADDTGFADLDINGHRETWPTRAKGFRRWLARRFFEATQGAPSSEALQSALNVIEARAYFDAPEGAVHIRVGGLDGRLYLDLGDETW